MRIRPRSLACLAGFALALALPAGAAAQRGVPALRMGDSVRVAISASDPVLTSWGGYKAFRFEAQPERVYQFSARADSGRVGLRVARAAGALTDYLAGSGGGMTETRAGTRTGPVGPTAGSALLRFRPPAAGPYLLVLASPDAGEFTVHAQEISPVAAVPRPIVPGTPVEGELGAASGLAFDGDDERSYDLYTFSGVRGQELRIVSTGRVTHSFGRMQDGRFVEIVADSTGSPDWRTLPDDGEYAVRVWGVRVPEDGLPYTLRLLDARPEARRLEVGRAAQGVYDPATAFPVSEHEMVDEWVLRGSAGQRLRIALNSTAFDTYLVVGRMQEGRFEALDDDDDGGGGTDSRVDLTLSADGDYVVRVQPYGNDRQVGGPYTLQATLSPRADSARTPRRTRPETRPVRWGAPMQGALDESDVLLEDGSPYDVWTFAATAGQRITITMRSEAFDAYLAVGREEDGEWMELTSNDDAVGQIGGDARVVMVAPDTGEYSIRANTFPLQPTGWYVLTVERER